MDRTPFIIYNSTVTPELHSEYTSYMNITPTVANLFDLTYDPRLYSGKDLFAKNYENRVYFADGSWKDPKAFYSASTGKIVYKNNNETYTPDEIKKINTTIKNRIAMSNLAIKTNYFDYLYKAKEDLKIKQDKEREAAAKAEAEKQKQEEAENQNKQTN